MIKRNFLTIHFLNLFLSLAVRIRIILKLPDFSTLVIHFPCQFPYSFSSFSFLSLSFHHCFIAYPESVGVRSRVLFDLTLLQSTIETNRENVQRKRLKGGGREDKLSTA